MEARIVLLNEDMVAVRLDEGSYSVFRLRQTMALEIGDSFLGPLNKLGAQKVLHLRSGQWIEVQIKLARSHIAAQTKRYVLKTPSRLVKTT